MKIVIVLSVFLALVLAIGAILNNVAQAPVTEPAPESIPKRASEPVVSIGTRPLYGGIVAGLAIISAVTFITAKRRGII